MTPTISAASLLAQLEPMLTRLAREPAAVRDTLGQFAMLTFLVGDRNNDGDRLVESITLGLELSEDDVARLMPYGHVPLESIVVTPPTAAEDRDLAFILICAVAATSRPPTRTQVQVLAHLGAGLGLPEPDITRIVAAELGLPLNPPPSPA